jgi:hypothetical protein
MHGDLLNTLGMEEQNMSHDPEIYAFLLRICRPSSRMTARFTATTHPDLTLYEWWVMPHRLTGCLFTIL